MGRRTSLRDTLIAAVVATAVICAGCSGSDESHPSTADITTTLVPKQSFELSGWLPYWDDGRGLAALSDNVDLFGEIHPFWYEATPAKVELQASETKHDAVVAAVRAGKAKLIPTVTGAMDPSDFATLARNETKRRTHADTICKLATDHEYDGIDINYEHFAVTPKPSDVPELAQLFAIFVGELAKCLHTNGKLLEVTVMARTDDSLYAPYRQKLAIGVYDYAAIAEHADLIRPMAYDHHYPGGPPGSIDPIQWVEQVIDYTTSHVDRSRVQLGLPLYGQDWAGAGADVVEANDGASLAAKHNATVVRDDASQSLTFQYQEDGRVHHVWYDDSYATRARVRLACEKGLHGASFWAIGYESSEFWKGLLTECQTTRG